MSEIVIRLGAREAAVFLSAALLFGGGFATVSAFNGGATTQGLPMVLPYQGTLAKDGMPVDGTQPNVIFKLHDIESGGVPLWRSDSRTLDVKDGKFAVTLGDSNDSDPLERSNFVQPSLYLSTTIDGVELSPRQRVAPTPQALVAAEAHSAEGILRAELDMNAQNMQSLTNRVDVTESELSRVGSLGQTTTSGIFCGETGAQFGQVSFMDGTTTLNGLPAAKRLCEQVQGCGNNAHMCTTHELNVSAQIGNTPLASETWVLSGMRLKDDANDVNYNCAGFSSLSDATLVPGGWILGTTFVKGPGANQLYFSQADCRTSRPIACCQ